MTIREFYEHVLTELNKVEAPSLLLEDFNYFVNKAVQQYINKVYNRYDINQQSTDDLRALKVSTYVDVSKTGVSPAPPSEESYWTCLLPIDYLHMLNCIVVFESTSSSGKCSNLKKKTVRSMARRLTSDIYPAILQNAYLKPSYKNPYYFLSTRNYMANSDANFLLEKILEPCVTPEEDPITNPNLLLEKILNPCKDLGEEDDLNRPKIEILCGSNSSYRPIGAFIDYLKIPDVLNLSYDELDNLIDDSQVLEFPEYVCYELINEFVKLALENASDPRLETNVPINQTIAGVSNNN